MRNEQLPYQSEIIEILFTRGCENADDKPQMDGLLIFTSLTSFFSRFDIDVTLQPYEKTVDGIVYKRANLIAKKKDSTGPFIALQGHIDTVPCGEPYTYTVTGEEIIGRGAVDMKGPLLGCISAFIELIQAGNDRFMLIITDDEETDFAGITKLIEEKDVYIPNVVACINAEPTNLYPCFKTRGFGQYELLASGYTAHSSSDKNDFLIERMIPLINATSAFLEAARTVSDPRFGNTIAALTVLQSGIKSNQLPSDFQLICNMRLVTEDLKIYKNMFDTIVRPFCTNITINEVYFAPFESVLPDNITSALKQSFDDCEYKEEVMHAFTEAYMFNNAGIPCFSWGPGNMNLAHVTPDEERISLREIMQYRHLILSFAASL